MAMRYKQIGDGRRVKVNDGALYVMQTNMCNGMLEQGGYADRVYKMPYTGTLDDAQVANDFGISDIDRCIERGDVVRRGRLIY